MQTPETINKTTESRPMKIPKDINDIMERIQRGEHVDYKDVLKSIPYESKKDNPRNISYRYDLPHNLKNALHNNPTSKVLHMFVRKLLCIQLENISSEEDIVKQIESNPVTCIPKSEIKNNKITRDNTPDMDYLEFRVTRSCTETGTCNYSVDYDEVIDMEIEKSTIDDSIDSIVEEVIEHNGYYEFETDDVDDIIANVRGELDNACEASSERVNEDNYYYDDHDIVDTVINDESVNLEDLETYIKERLQNMEEQYGQ